jgi:hypothetical protein
MYNGVPNQGMCCNIDIIQIRTNCNFQIFDVWGNVNYHIKKYDIYISFNIVDPEIH